MRTTVELPDVHNVGLVLEHSCLVVTDEVIRRAKYCHHRREAGCFRLSVHAISSIYQQTIQPLATLSTSELIQHLEAHTPV
jgi:hypothetical protein